MIPVKAFLAVLAGFSLCIANISGTAIKMLASAGTVTDIDGNVYQSVRIGNQVWMAENLRVTKYNDGSGIPLVTDSVAWRQIYDSSLTTPAYCFYKNTTDSGSIKKFGALYNWYVVNPSNLKKIAPAGWHVPSDAEWDTLQNNLIAKGYNYDSTITGNKIAKSLAAKTDWVTYSTAGTIGCDLTLNNRSSFSALPGGCRTSVGGGGFYGQRYYGHWWSATERNASVVSDHTLSYDFDYLYRKSGISKSWGFSVRLVRDN